MIRGLLYAITNTIGGERKESPNQEKLYIFDNIQTINSLSDGEIPEDLIGRYEMNHFIREFGCTGEEYLFNGIRIDKEEFFKILREQKKISFE